MLHVLYDFLNSQNSYLEEQYGLNACKTKGMGNKLMTFLLLWQIKQYKSLILWQQQLQGWWFTCLGRQTGCLLHKRHLLNNEKPKLKYTQMRWYMCVDHTERDVIHKCMAIDKYGIIVKWFLVFLTKSFWQVVIKYHYQG